MTSSANSTPSIDNDSITNIKSTSNPYSYSNSNRQGSISTLWSSAELPFFLDSRSNQHLHSSPNSNHISNHHHASNNNSARPSISGSFTSNYALDRDRSTDRHGLGMALGNGAGASNGSSSSGGRPSISSEFSLNFTSRKGSKGEDGSDGDRRKEDFEELDDHPHTERERERRSSPSSYNHQISNRSREKEREREDHHPYPFSGPESSFTDLNSSRDLHSFSSPSTSSSPPKHSEIQNTIVSSSSTASNRPKQSRDQESSFSSSSIQHSGNDRTTTQITSNQRSFSSNFDSPKKEKELRGYQKRRPNHLGLNLPSSSSTSSSHQSKPSEIDSFLPKTSPRRDISAPSMPISVSYGSQLSSVYGLNSSKDGHSPIFNHGSESIPPIPSSPLLFSSNDHHQQGENLEDLSHGLKVPGLKHDLSSRSSTSGSTLISPITPHTNLPSVPLPTQKKKSKKPALTHEQLYKRANRLFDSNYTVESPNASVEVGEDYMDQTVVEHNEGDNSNEISNTSNGSGNTSSSYEAPLSRYQEMEQDFSHQNQSPSFNASETILHRQVSHSSVRTGDSGNGSASYISVFTDDGSQGTGRNGNGDASLTGTPFSRISQLDDNHTSSSSDFSPASSNLPELDSHSNYSYSNNSSKNGVLRNHYENHEYHQGITPTKEISLDFQAPRLSNKPSISSNHSNRVFHGTSTSSLGRTAILNQSQISLSPRKSSFLPLSPTHPNPNQLNGRSPPISPRRPPSSPGRMNGNSPSFNLLGGPPLSPSKKSMRPSTANTMVQSQFNHQNGSVSSQNSSSLGLQVSPNHPYRSMIEAGLPPTLSAENLIKRDSSTSSASTNHSGSSNAGNFTKRLRAVSASSRLKVLPNWNNIFSSSSKETNSKENKDLDIGILACDSPTQLSINGSSSMHSGSVSNGPSSPVSMNRIPLPLSSQHSQSSSQIDGKIRSRPVSEQKSPPPANVSGTFTTSNSTSGITGPLGRFRSRTLGSADRKPSSSQASSSMPGFQPPSPTTLVQNLPSYPPSASKSGTMNLKSLRRPSKTDTLNSSINGGNGGNRTPSISLSTSERGSGIFGYESSGGGSSKRNSSNQKESNKSQSNSNDASKASLPPKSPSSNRNSSRPKSKGGWASHLAAGLTLHLTSESLDGIPSSRGCQVIMNYMYYDPFGKPESLVPKDQYPRPTTPKKSKSRNGEKGNEKEEEKESAEDTSGILEFSPKPFEETSTTKFSESDEFCFSINSSLILKHLTIGNDLKGDLISRQATISLANLGTHSVSGLERKGKLAWRFVYAVEDRSIMIENESSGVFEKVNIRGERKLRPISFQCSSTLLDPSRARKSRLITMVKKSVGSQITSTKVGGDREFSESPSSSKADLSAINNQSVGSLSIPPSPGYSIHQNGPRPQSSFNRKPSDSSLKRQANSSGWNPPPNLVPFRMTRPSVAPSNSTANTSNSSNRSSAASQSPHHQHQPLPSSPSRSHYPPSASQNHEGIVTRRRGASFGEASRANPIGLLNGNQDGTNQTLRSVSGNSGSVGKGNSTSRNRPSMARKITAERELPTLPASSSPGPHHQDPSSSRYSEKAPPSSPFRSKAYEEDYGLSPKSVPDSLPAASVRRERDPNRPPTASESIKLEYLSRDSDAARSNGRFVSNSNQGLNDRSVSISNLKDSFNNQLDARRERSKTHEDSSSSSFGYGIRSSSSNPQPFDLNEIQSQASSQKFNLKSIRRPDTAQPLLSPTKDEFFQQSNAKKSNSMLLAPFQMKEKSKNKTQDSSNQNVKELKTKSSFKSFSSGHKKSSQRARTATAEPRTGALLVEMGWI